MYLANIRWKIVTAFAVVVVAVLLIAVVCFRCCSSSSCYSKWIAICWCVMFTRSWFFYVYCLSLLFDVGWLFFLLHLFFSVSLFVCCSLFFAVKQCLLFSSSCCLLVCLLVCLMVCCCCLLLLILLLLSMFLVCLFRAFWLSLMFAKIVDWWLFYLQEKSEFSVKK